MSRLKRWTTGIAVGALVGFLGVALYNTAGGSSVCKYGVTDEELQRQLGITYATELCDRERPVPPLDYYGESIDLGVGEIPRWRHEGGSGWGAFVAVIGFGVLTWLIPVTMGRIGEEEAVETAPGRRKSAEA